MSTEQDKIRELEDTVGELNRVIALHNKDKYQEKIKISNDKLAIEQMNLEAFSTDGNLFTKIMVSKYVDSDFVNITFVPNEGNVLQVHMTEKSYMKFHDIIDAFKIKSISTR